MTAPSASLPNPPFAEQPPPKLNRIGLIVTAAFFGGGLAAAYLVHENQRKLGRLREARLALLIFGAIGAGFFVIGHYLPEDLLSVMLGLGIPQPLLIWAVLHWTRLGDLAGYRAAGGPYRSLWHALAIGLWSNILISAAYYCVALLWV